LCGGKRGDAKFALPAPVARLLVGVLDEIGRGNGVTVTPVHKDLSTQQAADLLRVSRPFLIEELLDKGVIPFRKVGNRRRIRYDDVRRFQEAEKREIARRESAMRELIEETERMGLYR
jgi:excisionase family DNA binding protein